MQARTLRTLVVALPTLLVAACVLAPQDLQAFRLFFTLNQDLTVGQQTEVHSAVYPAEVKSKKHFVKIFGRIEPAPGGPLPSSVDVEVVLTDLATNQSYFTFKQTVQVAGDGTFAQVKKFKKDVLAGTLQTVFVRPVGAPVASGTEVALCIEVAKKKPNLSADGACLPGGGAGGGGGGANVVTVRVIENAFDPQQVLIQAGQTVRWVLDGAMFNHTVTAMNGAFDSGFSFDAVGAVFERTFSAAENNQTFEYSCQTHKACCAMQGSVRVGNDSPPPDPGY